MFNPDYSNTVNIIDSSTGKQNTIFEVIEYKKLRKSGDYNFLNNSVPLNLNTNYHTGQKLRQVRININGGGILTQRGALQFMKGPIVMEVNSNLSSSVKGFFKNIGTGESSYITRYYGNQGEIYLEPSYEYFYILELDNDQIILDDGLFYCCEDTLEFSIHTNKNISIALFGGDGFRQPQLKGSGIAILESPVPFDEVLIYDLNNETLKVDGNLAIAIQGKIETNIEKSTKSVIGSIKSGEGFLHSYTGTGQVWLAPTRKNIPINF